MIERKWCVYCHTNKLNNKKYIGITSESDPKNRWKNGYGYKPDKGNNQNVAFWNAIQKYGWENFDHEILADNLTEDKAKELEKYYIKYYETFIGFHKKRCDRKGYNSTLGGDGTCGLSGELHPNYGTHLTEWQKQRISEHNSVPVCEYNKDGKLIKEWKSEKDICDCYGVDYKTLWEIMHGKRVLSWKGKIFRYKGEQFDKYRTEKLDMSGEKHPMYGRKHTKESINKIKNNRKGKAKGANNYNSQKVICDGIVFSCIRECQEYLDIPYTTLVCWLRGRNPMPKNYIERGLSVVY